MSDIAIRVEGLGKKYRLGANTGPYKTLRESLTGAATAPLRAGARLARRTPTVAGDRGRRPEFWAVKDVSFDVKHGEVLGIIGRNGAGKSTLLKLLSQITEPTEGRIGINGRVASLLEVGTGFHPELTGRENVLLNGAILGMSRTEILRKFDEIVAFAEVEKFIDTPVKHYSSGMYLRLAFSVAAHLEPEILIVDEVLAVGDASFQKKCLGKMSDVAGEGRTVLFVSHNMAAVKSLCQNAILLQAGHKVAAGTAARIVDHYIEGGESTLSEHIWPDVNIAPGSDKARLRAVRILDTDGTPALQAPISKPLTIEVEYSSLASGAMLSLSISLFNQDGVYVLASASVTDTQWFMRPHPKGLFRSRCIVPANLLNQGRYMVTVLLVENGQHVVAQEDGVVSIDMIDLGENRASYFGQWGGVIRPLLDWATEFAN